MRFASFASWCLCAILGIALACAAAPDDIPEAMSLLVDEAGALSEAEREALLARLKAIERSERAQVAILVARGTGGETLAEYALRVAEKWGLGRAGRDDGLLIVAIPSPTAVRIEVGYGLEAAIPDARASRWVDEVLPAVREREIARGLGDLLDKIEKVLPEGKAPRSESGVDELFPGHPEWNVPFVLVIFSFFAIFPMFFGRWGSIPAAFILAAMWGAAAGAFWDSRDAAFAVAAAAFPLPLLWSLNYVDTLDLPAWLRWLKALGNAAALAVFFALLSLFVCVGLYAMEEPLWPGFIFSGLLTVGVAAHLFPDLSHYVLVFLRSAMHFVFILVLVWAALGAFIPDASRIALAVATLVTGLAALGLYLDSRGRRGSKWLFGIAFLIALPFALLALILAIGGEDARTQLIQAAAGGGTLAGILALAARIGLIAAVKVGLGGRFGGGGAGRSD